MDLDLFADMSLAGFLTLGVLLFCSIVMVAIGWELRKRSQRQFLDGTWLLVQVRYLLFERKVAQSKVRDYLAQIDRPVADICRELLNLESPNLEAGDYLLSSLVDRKRLELERGLSHLGTIAVIAPFVGLFGTVVGITKTFADVAEMGKAGIEVVSAGVSEALVATAIGLLVAIISVVLFNHFKTEFDNAVTDWDLTARACLTLLTGPQTDHRLLFKTIAQQIPTTSADTFLAREAGPEEQITEEG